MIAVLAIVVAVLAFGWAIVIGYLGSQYLMHGDGIAHGCPTPAVYGWPYEAVNYDIALDDRLAADNPDWLHDCPTTGRGTAGDEVVSPDGVRLAAWYIPSGDGAPATAPTVVIVHGWGVSKSDALRYATALHDRWNLLLIDTRATGRASGEWMSFGVREASDLRAMLDWLERTKHPSAIAVLGDSGGASASATLARTDQRISALVLESPMARLRFGLEARAAGMTLSRPAALSVPVSMAAFWLRTGGVWLGDADPIDSIARLGRRPLAISYGTDDRSAIPERNALALYEAALAEGVPVEIHACEGAGHGQSIDTCRDDYRTWLEAFLDRSIGGTAG